MSKEIENRVVSMEFDNSKFDKPAKESMSTLDKLKQALNFKGVETGLDSMSKAIKSITFTPLTKGVDSVYAKFTALERFTIQLYDRLSNKIIDMGLMLGREMFTTPKKSGYQEYELKMGAIQVMLNSTGESLDVINQKLDELNKYSDDTIYSFSDMTQNIGKFTNAGVDLDTSVAAIKGISNVAALAGANSNEASRAMYNFSQALSMGSVRLQDWMSIENANMATKSFKEELISSAVELGTLQKAADGTYSTLNNNVVSVENFRNSLSDAWLTTDVLTKTLGRFSDATTDIGKKASQAATEVKTFSMLTDTLKEALQSGWTETWQNIVGDFEQAKTLWTSVSNELGQVISNLSEGRNSVLRFWSAMGGRASMLQGFANIWKSIKTIVGSIRDSFRQVFPAVTGKRLVQITRAFEDLTARLRPTNETLQKISRAFRGLFSVFGIGVDAIKSFISVFAPLFAKTFRQGTNTVTKTAASLGDWLTKLRETIREGRYFEKIFQRLASAVGVLGKSISALLSYFSTVYRAFRFEGFSAGFDAIKTGFVRFISFLWETVKKADPIGAIKKLGRSVINAIKKWPVTDAFKNLLSGLYDFLKNNPVTGFIIGLFEGLVGSIQSIIDRFASIDISGPKKFTKAFGEQFRPLQAFKDFIVKIFNGILEFLSKIAPAFKAIGNFLGTTIRKVFGAIFGIIERSDLGDIAALLAGGGIGSLTFNIGKFFSSLSGGIEGFSKIGESIRKVMKSVTETFSSVQKALDAVALKQIAVAIALLAGALVVLSAIPLNELAKASAVIVELFVGLSLSMRSLSKTANGLALKGTVGLYGLAVAMISMSTAVLILSGVIAALSFIEYEKLAKGLVAVSAILFIITKFISSVSSIKHSYRSILPVLTMAVLLQSIAVSLLALTIATKVDEKGLSKGIAAITSVIAVITVAYYAIAKTTKFRTIVSAAPLMSMVFLLISISASLLILTIANKVDSNGLADSVLALVSVIGAITIAYMVINASTKIKSVFSIAPILAMSAAISAISLSLGAMAIMTNGRSAALIASTGAVIAVLSVMTLAYIAINQQTSGLAALKTAPIVALIHGLMTIVLSLSLLTFVTSFNPDALTDATLAIVAIMVALTVMCGVISKLSLTTGIKTAPIIALAIAVALLTIPLALMIRAIKNSGIGEGDKGDYQLRLIDNLSIILIGLTAVVISVVKLSKKIKISSMAKATLGIIAITGLVAALSLAMKGLEKIKTATIGKLALLLSAVAVITLIFSAMASLKAVSTGLSVISKTMLMLSAAVMIGSAAISLLVLSLKSLTSMSTEELNALKENIAKLADIIISERSRIAKAIGSLIAGILQAIVEALRESSQMLIEEGLILIMQALDTLVSNAPAIIDKILVLLGQLLDGLARRMPELTDKLTNLIIRLMNGLASAIRKYGTEFSEAVGDLMDAVSDLVGQTVTKLLGIANETFPAVVAAFTRVILPIIAVVEILGALKKALSFIPNIHSIITILKKIPGIITGKIIPAIKLAATFIAAHPWLVAISAVAIAVAGLAKHFMDTAKVITENDQYVIDSLGKIAKEEQHYQDLLKKRTEAFSAIDSEAKSTEQMVEKLRECVDQNGKIKDGYEARFNFLKNNLRNELDIQVDAETGIVSIINEQNQALDIQSEKINEIIKRKAFQSKLEEASASVEKERQRLDRGDYQMAEAQARKDYQDWLEGTEKLSEYSEEYTRKQIVEMYDEWRKLGKMGYEDRTTEQKQRYFWLNEQKDKLIDVAAANYALSQAEDAAHKNTMRATAYVQNYDKAYSALDGTMEEVQKATVLLDKNFVLSNAGAGLEDVKGQLKDVLNGYELMLSQGVELSDETQQYYEAMVDTLGQDIKTFGQEGMEYLDEIGYTSGKQYLSSMRKAMMDERDAGKTLSKWFETAGVNDVAGLLKYLSGEGYKTVEEAYANLGAAGLLAFMKEHKIASPSKVFEQYGIYDVLGLINGVTKKEGTLEKAYSAMATANVAAYTAAMSKQTSGFAWSPLVNTSGFQNGINSMQSQFAGLQNGVLNTGLSTRLAASVDMTKLEESNRELNRTMVSMRQDFAALSETLQDMQIVLDDGTLVGRLAPALDAELGRRTARRSRGV